MTEFRPDKYMPNPAGGFWLPLCASTRTRPGALEPEVWFRIVHATQNGHNGAPVAAYREQRVEIARQEGITRARVTQVMGMLRRAPEIQEHILSMPVLVPRPSVSELALRPIEPITDCRDQLREFYKFLV